MSKKISGITVAINGDTSGLAKSLNEVTSQSVKLSKNLKTVNNLLKLDPGNAELLAQKQKLLAESIETTKEKLKALEAAQEGVKQQFENGEIDTEAYLEFQRELLRTQERLEDLEEQANEAGDDVDELGDQTEDAADDMQDAEKKTKNFSESLKTGLVAAAKVAAAAVAAAGAAVLAFSKDAIEAGMQFDTAMSQVAATMGMTTEEIAAGSESFESLRAAAIEAGRTTAFSATESANALNYLALAGYDAETAIATLPTILDLAAAGGIDLAYASDMVTDASSALGLSLEESKTMVDEMARASSKSNTSVAQLGEAILTVGGTASYMHGSTDELCTVLGILADNGIKGSEAGTHLRNMLLSVSAPTDDAAKMLDKLNLEIFDADGKMRSFAEVFPELNTAMADFSDEEKLEVFSTLFNTRDIATATALLNTSTERWKQLGSAISDSKGAAGDMAEVQLDNLAGDVTLFKSALEGLQIAFTDQLNPVLREFVQSASSALSTLTESLAEGDFEGFVDSAVEIISNWTERLIGYIPTILQVGARILGALLTGIVAALPQLVSAGLQVLQYLADSIAAAVPVLVPTLVNVITQIALMLTDPNVLVPLIEAGNQILLGVVQGLMEALPTLIAALPVIIENVITVLAASSGQFAQVTWQLVMVIVSAVIQNLPQIIGAALEIIGAMVAGLIQGFGSLSAAGTDIVGNVGSGIMLAINNAATWGKDLIDNFVSGIKNGIGKVISAAQSIAQTVRDYIGFSEPEEGPLSNFHTYAPDMIDLFTEGIDQNAYKIHDQFAKSLSGLNVAANLTGRRAAAGDMLPFAYASGSDMNLHINVNVGSIANDYDVGRMTDTMIEQISQGLEHLKMRQTAAAGGVW